MHAVQKLQCADIFLILLYPFAMLRHTCLLRTYNSF